MFNMIKLDWLCMRSLRYRVYLALLAGVATAIFIHPILAIITLPFVLHDFGAYPFLAEETGKVNLLYMTLPVNRKVIVRARFGFMLFMCSIGLIIAVILTLAGSALLSEHTTILTTATFNVSIDTMLLAVANSILICSILNLAIFPIFCKVGYSKAKIVTTVVSVGLIILPIAVVQLGERFVIIRDSIVLAIEWGIANIRLTSIILIGLAVVLFATSHVLAQKNYAMREF